MASYRNGKTGNCSDCSQNKLLQEKPPETFRSLSLFLDRLPYAAARGGVASTHGNREAPP